VRGNIPQIAFTYHSDNDIYGTCLNPWDHTRTCGGSSGGDSGLVAARCTPMGIGSDIGGSIRAPVHFCGVFGYKPSGLRTSLKGISVALPDNFTPFNHIAPSVGPVGRSVDDLITFFKV
jgi:fatty acid amide hydrolase